MHRGLTLPAMVLLAVTTACGEGPTQAGPSPTPSAGIGDLADVQVSGGRTSPYTLGFDTPFRVEDTQTRVLTPGDGPTIEENDTVLVDYVGVSGTTAAQFDSSWAQGGPQAFPLVPQQMIVGFIDGLVGQRVGSELLVAMPPADAYGSGGNPQAGIAGTDTLLFAVHVLAGSDPDPLPKATGKAVPLPKDVPSLEFDDDGRPVRFTTAGTQPAQEPTELGIFSLIQGDGPPVQAGDLVTVHYLGQLYPDGEVFDESWSDGEPATFQIGAGALIKAWDQGLVGQRVGSRVVLVVPPEFGYGAQGAPPTVPPGASLIFSVDILGVGATR